MVEAKFLGRVSRAIVGVHALSANHEPVNNSLEVAAIKGTAFSAQTSFTPECFSHSMFAVNLYRSAVEASVAVVPGLGSAERSIVDMRTATEMIASVATG